MNGIDSAPPPFVIHCNWINIHEMPALQKTGRNFFLKYKTNSSKQNLITLQETHGNFTCPWRFPILSQPKLTLSKIRENYLAQNLFFSRTLLGQTIHRTNLKRKLR